MFKNLKAVAISIAVIIVIIFLWIGIPAGLRYNEGKATAEVNVRQEQERLNVQGQMTDLTIGFNHDLSKEVAASTEYFNTQGDKIDAIIAQRQAAAVVLPAVVAKGSKVMVTTPDVSNQEPLKPKDDVVSELTLAWESFCKIRPTYKDCIEGTHP